MQCQRCGLPVQGPGQVVARRQVFDLPQPRLFVEEHQVLSHKCPCGCVQTGHFPAGAGLSHKIGQVSQVLSFEASQDDNTNAISYLPRPR